MAAPAYTSPTPDSAPPDPAKILTTKQQQALALLGGPASHIALYGGSRSGKTFLFLAAIIWRAIKAPYSRHAVLRFRFSHVKSAVVLDTFPFVMRTLFPGVKYHLDKSDWYAQLENGSQIWFGGLDEKERTEKVLGTEYSTIFLNECSQIPYTSRNIAVTRLAQQVMIDMEGVAKKPLPLKMYYDLNPPTKSHWSYYVFHRNIDPDTKRQLDNPKDYCWMQVNPEDNLQNLPAEYIKTLESLPHRMRVRFLKGEYADETAFAYFHDITIEQWRVLDGKYPDLVRLVVGVDPSGSGDILNADSDEIGVVAGGLGTDGNAYLLEDLSLRAGPRSWGAVVGSAFDRLDADVVVGEVNYGGAMVEHVIRTARPRTPFKEVRATRGKTVRAEPFSALYEQGKVRHVGHFMDLEEELCAMTQYGYTGQGSPNRADAWIWVLAELFPAMVKQPKEEKEEKPKKPRYVGRFSPTADWMGA